MDDPLNIPGEPPFEPAQTSDDATARMGGGDRELKTIGEQFPESATDTDRRIDTEAISTVGTTPVEMLSASSHDRPRADVLGDAALRRRRFRNNLFLLLCLVLAAFTLTSWIFVRLDSPFGIFSTGPQEIVRAQLRALDRGEVRPAYDMLSARYREHVSFDDWHKLIVTHWRMFHAEVLRSGTLEKEGPGVTLEIYLHGADDKDYRARFTLVRAGGRWWIDDVHWSEEDGERDFIRS